MRLVAVTVVLVPALAAAQVWQDATPSCIGTTAEWSNKIEVADLDGDGAVDILIANGGSYSSAGSAEPLRVWRNLNNWSQNGAHCTEVTQGIGFTGLSRFVKVADVDGDGDLDIVTGGAWQSQLKLFTQASGVWSDASSQLPQGPTSAGDAEFGDVDGDGDLDLVIADWGAGNPGTNAGGRTRLYLNDGHGTFTDATDQMPTTLVRWSWDMELIDVDNDWDLDVLVSSKRSATQFLFRNDGTGHFTEDTTALPKVTNNYDFEAMDVDGDGDLDLATINDGPNGTDLLFINKGDGTFTDETSSRITGTANPGTDDNAVVFLDADNDGDADMVVASLSGRDRLLLNDGSGHFTLSADQATPDDTPGSLGIAAGDLDGDGRIDLVQAQGEVDFPDKVQLASTAVGVDTQKPVVRVAAGPVLHARVHDHQSPSHLHDWKSVVAMYADGSTQPMTWYGEYLWRGNGQGATMVCATDRANNTTCTPVVATADDGGIPPDAPPTTGMTKPGGCCDAGGEPPLALLLLVSARIRWTRRRSGSAPRRRRSA
jgi:hypothetical protein